MSEPLSVTASIIAVLQLSATATQFVKDIKHGSAHRTRLRDELRSATCLIEMLKDRIEDGEDDETDEALKPMSIKSLSSPDGPLALFKQVLEDIVAKLAPQDRFRRLAQPITWPFDKKEIAELISSLERLKNHLSLVLQNDLIELAKLSHLKLDDIKDHIEYSETRFRDDEMQKIIQWISPISFRARHIAILEAVQPGTGVWFFEHQTFRRWVDGNIAVLWCPGIPGAGKTVLASHVIDHLERHDSRSQDTAFAYIYCDYNQRKEQTPTVLMSSVLQQLLQHSTGVHFPPELSSLYDLHRKYGTRPTLTQITDILRKFAVRFKTIHVVIDALDECAETEEDALRLVSDIRSLGAQVKLLCTSRFSTTLESYFEESTRLEIAAQNDDIGLFLDAQIQRQQRLSRHVRADPTLKKDIIEAITDECQGMFLLAKLHVESLSQKFNRKEVRATLGSLPETLNATYADALQRVYAQAPDAVDLAKSVLFWVICARRSLTVLELQQLYAVRDLPDAVALEEDDLPDADIVTGVCGGLVIVDADTQCVRAVHYTAQQFFETAHIDKLIEARKSLSDISLTYLVLPNFSDGVCATDIAMAQRLEEFPFLEYAAKYWGSGATDDSSGKIHQFTQNRVAIRVASQVFSLPSARYGKWSQEYPRGVPPLVLVAAFDLPDVLRRMILDGHDIEGCGTDGETPLIRSAYFGHNENVQTLLNLGANVNARDYMEETATHKAARIGATSVVNTLIEGGAPVNLRATSAWTALMSAVSSGNLEVVRVLVQAGAELNAETHCGDSALSIATRNGQEAIATLLADHGAILPNNRAGRRASLSASRRGYQQLVRRLTADYEAVAGRPLQRQTSRLMQGLRNIVEDAEVEAGPPPPQARGSDTETDEDEFLDILEGQDRPHGFLNRYQLLERLGRGNFAEVYLCASLVTGVRFAVKVFASRSTRINEFESLKGEFDALRQLSHPNILRMVELCAEHTPKRVYVVMEIAPEGELFNFIVMKKTLTEAETRRLFSQLFSAIEYMHNLGWVHRDIKPENILLADIENLTLKLADFGLAKKVDTEEGTLTLRSLCGTPSYVAPEILTERSARRYGPSVDIWSAGVVLYICLCGFPPFSDELYTTEFPYTLADQIKGGRFDYPSPYWDPVGDPALDLIDNMLTVDVDRRYTVQQCLSHPWTLDTTVPIIPDPIVPDMVRTESPVPMA
ncbi:hypothetical protein F4778DRAFT_446080 [Xylariomycetidae sp. FL2044]|nr:hypothetical protein F4778DRAFT_446080 [Xylariomycetidae sp. FL2044]